MHSLIKRLGGLSFVFFMGLFGTAQAQSSTPSWDSLNIAFEQIALEHQNTFDFVNLVNLEIDKKQSDWEQGNLKVDLHAESKELNLISTSEPQFLQLDGGLNLNSQNLADGKTQVSIDLQVEIGAEIVYLLRHINTLAMDCGSTSPSPADTFTSEFCKYTEVIALNDKAKDWQAALEHFKNALMSFQSPSDPNAPLGILDQILGVLAQAKTSGDETHSKLTALTRMQILGLDLDAKFQLIATDSALTLSLQGDAVLNQADYQTYKKALGDYLVLIQQNDVDAMDQFYNYSFLIFGLLEGFLI